MTDSPEEVELYENGHHKLTLTNSAQGSLDGVDGYSGHARSARIIGAAGSVVAFYDDQQVRRGENHVTIEKLVDDPIDVPLAQHFVSTKRQPAPRGADVEAERAACPARPGAASDDDGPNATR